MSNFAITGMGRSGTKYLAAILNQSPTWLVVHEPHAGFQSVREVRDRFAARRYGEVNSYLRHQLLALHVTPSVIIRDPMEIFRSMYARGRPRLDHLDEALRAIDELLQCNVRSISFRRMTSDITYVRDLAHRLGVDDLPEVLDLTSLDRNASPPTRLPPRLERQARARLAWFTREYGDRL
jgi:hypothetical protein